MIRELLRLRPGASLAPGDGAEPVTLDLGRASMSLGPRDKGARAALSLLAAGTADEDEVVGTVIDLDGEEAALGFQILLRRLVNGGLVARRFLEDGRDLFELVPTAFRAPKAVGSVQRGGEAEDVTSGGCAKENAAQLQLSRFTYLRTRPEDAGGLSIENPLAELRIVLADPRLAAVVAMLTRPIQAGPDVVNTAGVSAEVWSLLVDQLVYWGFASKAGNAESPSRMLWSLEDLAFHRASRLGYHTRGYGGTYRLEGRVPPTPGRRPEEPLAIEFDPPDLEEIARRDPPLTAVIEARSSRRHHDDGRPIRREQLGELLFRTLRVRQRMADEHEDLLFRPVPSGGALHALDVYAAVRLCQGIAPGLYRYDGDRHGLVGVADGEDSVFSLMSTVPLMPGSEALPQILLVFSARFGRAMWKYESMAYALILKDLGVIYQSLYLVATAMGLAPCAQGGGDSELFCRLAGLDPLVEASVGEFALGSAAEPGGATVFDRMSRGET